MDQKVIRSKILIPLIEDSYRSEYTEYARRNLRCSDAGAASDEGEKCEREIFYDMTIPEKKSLLTNGTLVLFDDGRIHEQDIRRRLRLVLRSPERELKDNEILIDGRPVSGKIDNMVDIRKMSVEALKEVFPAGTIIDDPVLELKSVNEYSYQEMARSGRVNQTYYDQVQYYLFLTGAKWALILIKNRNSSGDEKGSLPFLEFIVLPDIDRQGAIRAGLKTVAECVEKKIIPMRPFLKASTKCSYCRYKFECWPEEKKAEIVVEEKEVVEAPGKELLDIAVTVYAMRQREIKVLEDQAGEARKIIERYFKATKSEELIVNNLKALYSKSSRSSIDKARLLAMIGASKYVEVSEPTRKLIEKAIEDRKLDASVIEEVSVPGKESYTLRVSEIKGIVSERQIVKEKEIKNDKGTIAGKENTAPRKNKARNKKGKSKRNVVSKRG